MSTSGGKMSEECKKMCEEKDKTIADLQQLCADKDKQLLILTSVLKTLRKDLQKIKSMMKGNTMTTNITRDRKVSSVRPSIEAPPVPMKENKVKYTNTRYGIWMKNGRNKPDKWKYIGINVNTLKKGDRKGKK